METYNYNHEENKRELARLEEDYKRLEADILAVEGIAEAPAPKAIVWSIELKPDTDLYSEEEHALIRELESFQVDASILASNAKYDLAIVEKARAGAEQYYDRIQTDDEESLDSLHTKALLLEEDADGLFLNTTFLRGRLTSLGWYRHFKRLKPPKILSELEKITNSLEVTADPAFNFREETNTSDREDIGDFWDKVTKTYEGSITIDCKLEHKYIKPIRRFFTLPYGILNESQQRKLIDKTVRAFCGRHLEALPDHLHNTANNQIISGAVDRLLAQAEEARTKIERVDGSIVRTNPIEVLAYPMTAITRQLFIESATFNPVTNEPVFMYSGNNNKPVHIFYSTSYADIEGVEGVENLTLEEAGICNALYSLFIAGNIYATNQMIKDARNKLGGKSKKRITAKEEARYTNFIEGANFIKIHIDQRAYAEAKGLPQKEFDDVLLDVKKAYDVNLNGTIVPWCWRINKAPVINVHAEMLGQQLSLPVGAVSVNIPAEHLPLRDYLINERYRIASDPLNTETSSEKEERLKAEEKKRAKALSEGKNYKPRKRKQHPTISFETIYEKVYGTTDLRTDKKKNIQKYTLIILNGWKALGWIKNYELLYEGVNRSTRKGKKRDSLLADAVKLDLTKTELLES